MKDIYTLNDNELLYMIRSGDTIAYQLMLEKYENYMLVLLKRFTEESEDESREDLMQECRMLLAELCMRYREDKGCRFITFLVGALKNRLRTYSRDEQRKYKNITFLSLDNRVVQEEGFSISYGEQLNLGSRFYQPEYEWRYYDSVEKLANMVNTLTPIERAVWKLMNEEISYDKAAEKMGISEKQFDNLRMRLKKKIVFCIMKSEKSDDHH